jgi:hypothetical protein
MSIKSKATIGVLATAAAGGAYFGVSRASADAENDEKLSRGVFMAGAGGVAAYAGMGFVKRGGLKFATKASFSTAVGVLKTKTGMMVGGGAALGAAIGAYNSDDPTSGAAKGAVIGAGGGLAVRGAMYTAKVAGRIKGSPFGAARGKMGFGGVAILGTIAAAVAAHSLAGSSSASSYSEMASDGETEYSDTPVKRRVSAMNATGDVVLGLHRKRRG